MKNRKNKTLTPKEYGQVKGLLDLDIPIGKVQKINGRSYSTIHTIKHSEDFKDYKRITSERWQKGVAEKAKKEAEVGEPNTSLPNDSTLRQELQEIKKVLISIDTALKAKSPRSFKMF